MRKWRREGKREQNKRSEKKGEKAIGRRLLWGQTAEPHIHPTSSLWCGKHPSYPQSSSKVLRGFSPYHTGSGSRRSLRLPSVKCRSLSSGGFPVARIPRSLHCREEFLSQYVWMASSSITIRNVNLHGHSGCRIAGCGGAPTATCAILRYWDIIIIIISYTVGRGPESCGYAVLLLISIVQKTVPCGRMKNCMLHA